MMNNSKIFFPLQIVMFLHLTDLIGIGVEAKVWNPSEKKSVPSSPMESPIC